MNMLEIRNRIRDIRIAAEDGDYERAHSLEDELYIDFVRHLTKGKDHFVIAKAKLVLSTQELQFPRWTA